jgi:hypothetical protein
VISDLELVPTTANGSTFVLHFVGESGAGDTP